MCVCEREIHVYFNFIMNDLWMLYILGKHTCVVQAASNGVYRSIKHRVLAAEKEERYSVAYFYSPSYDTVIESHGSGGNGPVYRKFTFREYKQQADKDVKELGDKVGLSRFLL